MRTTSAPLRLPALLLTFTFTFIVTLTMSAATTHTPWETTLSASDPTATPYTDTSVVVTYTHLPTGASHTAPAAWDGNDRWLLRNAFPLPGEWSWRTSASPADPGLHDQSGTVSVSPYTGDNPLYRHGFLQASADGRYLVHADGTPFFWLGDTAWRAPNAATPEQWTIYLHDRVSLGYSVIQISPIVDWDKSPRHNLSGELPFLDNDFARLNPAYWQHLDALVAEANDAGLVVMLTGLPGWRINLNKPEDSPLRLAFIRQLVGRFHGRHVVYSPSADQYHGEGHRTFGHELRAATSRQPITEHPGTHAHPDDPRICLPADFYYDDDYLTFCMYQSGHNEGDRDLIAQRARDWAYSLYHRPASRRLPVINGEAFYEGDPAITERPLPYQGTAYDARLCAYSSILSGSTAGFTNGILGIWDWNYERFNNAVPFDRALAKPSAAQLGHFARLLRTLPWWTLAPAPERILNQPTEPTRQVVFARDPAGTVAIAYLPDNPSVTLDLTGFTAPLHITWMNPVTGDKTAGPTLSEVIAPHTYSPPVSDQPDWLLLLTKFPYHSHSQFHAMFQDATHRIFHPSIIEHAQDALFELRTEGRHQVYPVHFARLTLVPGEPLVLDLDPYAPADSWRLQSFISPSSSREGQRLTLPDPQAGIFVVDQPNRSPLILRLDPPGPEPIPTGPRVHLLDPTAVPPDSPSPVTTALQAAFDATAALGPGQTLVIPAGTYLCGTLRLPSHFTLYLCAGATLKAVPDHAAFPPDPAADYPVPPELPAGLERNARARFIYLENCSHTHIAGRGTIDGSGLALRQAPGKETNINGIRIDRSDNCSISGITVRDTHFWAVHVYRSREIRIDQVAVINPNLHTTDGFDIDSSQDVLVTDCFAHTGDDVFVVKATAMRRGPAPSPARITFRRGFALSGCTALKLGSESLTPEFSDITYEQIRIGNLPVPTGRALAFELKDHAHFHHVTFRDITAGAVNRLVDLSILPRNAQSTTFGRTSEILLEDIHCGPTLDPPRFYGRDAAHPLEGITVRKVTLDGHPLTADTPFLELNDHANVSIE